MRNWFPDHVEGQLYKWRQLCQLIFMLMTMAVISVRDIGNWFETQVSSGTQKLPEISRHCQCHRRHAQALGHGKISTCQTDSNMKVSDKQQENK